MSFCDHSDRLIHVSPHKHEELHKTHRRTKKVLKRMGSVSKGLPCFVS